ncbi:hypothetical protein N9B60_05225 [Mariniblastus sp.]|nr:hypothetical protein [bacterium]MDA7924783.1 hypothetical protein [Mariniblastus sp.]MDA9352891.1 hypothetical protein [bacterium]MDB4385995.1 hypothetical protein [bacterium]
MRIQTTFLATLLTAVAVLATDCVAQTNQDNSSRFRFVAAQQNSNPIQTVNPAIQIAPVRRSLSLNTVPAISRPRTNELVAATFETTSSNDFALSRTFAKRSPILQPSPANTIEFQTIAESPSSTRTNIFGIDEDQCCDEWENFTACGGLKTNPGHYGIPWLTGKDNCEAPRGCGCGLRRSSLGCGTSACRSTSIECTKLKGIKGWFKKSDCQCDSCHPAESTVVEYVQER